MTKWYDRVGNHIEMKLFHDADGNDFEWVKGRVVAGYRYRDGIITMASENERIIWCGVESSCYRKTDDSLGDLITIGDKIREMGNEELADFLTQKFLHGVGNDLVLKWIKTEVEVSE